MYPLASQRIRLTLFALLYMASGYADNQSQQKQRVRVICEIQQRLGQVGLYSGDIDGRPGKKTKAALTSFLDSISYKNKRISFYTIQDYLRVYTKNRALSSVRATRSRPANGKIFTGRNIRGVAPLQIKTAARGHDFYVKLADAETGQNIKTAYIRGGKSANLRLPLGRYDLKYASGQKWYSSHCLFGMSTLYSKANKVFSFERKGNIVTGYSVELILQRNGNLSTKKIKAEDW